MATLSASVLRREFVYNGTVIPDPNPSLTPEQVRDTLVPAFPEIATAALDGPASSHAMCSVPIRVTWRVCQGMASA